MVEINNTLKEHNIFNNDMWKNNFLVKNNIIYFNWGAESITMFDPQKREIIKT